MESKIEKKANQQQQQDNNQTSESYIQKFEKIFGNVPLQDQKQKKDEKKDQEAEKKQIYSELFYDLTDNVSTSVQQKTALCVANNRDAMLTYKDSFDTLEKTLAELKDDTTISKEQLKLVDYIDSYRETLTNKLSNIAKMLLGDQKKRVKDGIGDNPEINAQAVEGLADKLEQYNELLRHCSDGISLINNVLKEKPSESVLKYVINLMSCDLVSSKTGESFDEMLSGEMLRARSRNSLLKCGPVPESDKFIINSEYSSKVLEELKAKERYDEKSPAPEIFSKSKELEEGNLNDEEQDVLMSYKLQATKLCMILQHAKDDQKAGNTLSVQDKVLSMITGIKDKMEAMSTNAVKALSSSGMKADDFREQCVTMAEGLTAMYAHMGNVYVELCKRISLYGENGADDKIIEMFSYMSDSLFQEKETPKKAEDIATQCIKVTANADMMLSTVAHEFMSGVTENDMQGSEYKNKFVINREESEESASRLISNVETQKKTDKTRAKKKKELSHNQIKELEAEKKKQQERLEELRVQKEAYKEKGKKSADSKFRVKYTNATLDEYKPSSALGSISEFTDYKNERVEGVGKMKAFFDKKKLKGEELKQRMGKHVRRFLSSRDGVTDTDIADFSNVLAESSGVLITEKFKSKEQNSRLDLIKKLYGANDATAIAQLSIQARKLVPAADEDNELKAGHAFYEKHPMAAKVIMLHSLLKTIENDSLEGASEEYCGRINALADNIKLLYGSITGSEEYVRELKKQKLIKIEADYEKCQNELRRINGELDTVQEKGKDKDADYKKAADHRVKEFREDLSIMSKAVEGYRVLKAGQKKSDVDVLGISKKIETSREEALKKKQNIRLKGPAADEAMDHGAESYLNTLLDKGALSSLSDQDREEIKQMIKKQIPDMLPKEKQDIKQLNADDVKSLVKRIEVKLNVVPYATILNGCRTADKIEYRRFFLDRLMSGLSYVSYDDYVEYKEKRKEAYDNVDGYLAHCELYDRNTSAEIKIIGMKKANTLFKKGHMRAPERVARMEGLEGFVNDIFKSINEPAPCTLYEYKKKYPITDGKGATENDINKYVDSYKKYIEDYFNAAKAKKKKFTKKDFLGEKYEGLDDVKKLILNCYSEYGAGVNLKQISKELGKNINDLGNAEYLEKLAPCVERAIKSEEERKELAEKIDQKKDEEKIKKYNDRLAKLQGQEKIYYLLDFLMDDYDFKVHFAADSDDEFDMFMKKIVPSCERIYEAMKGHMYRDQYLLEKEKEITDYILNAKETDAAALLELKKLDKEINKTEINGTPFGKLVDEKLGVDGVSGQDKTKEQVDAEHKEASAKSSMLTSLLLENGASAFVKNYDLDKELDRMSANYETLQKSIDHLRKEWDTRADVNVDALIASLHQKERDSVIHLAAKDYKKGLTDRLRNTAEVIINKQIENRKMTEAVQKTHDKVKTITAEKEKGRTAFNELFARSDEEFLKLKNPEDIDADEEFKQGLEDVTSLASEYMTDEFLESVYTSVLKNMIVSVDLGDKKSFNESKKFLNRMRAFSAAANYHIEKAKDSVHSDLERRNLKLGLFEYFGEKLMKESPKETDRPGEAVAYYSDMLEGFMQEKIDNIGIARFIMDDTGGIMSVSSEQAMGESKVKLSERKEFEKFLLDKVSSDSKDVINAFSKDDRVLFEYLLMNRTGLMSLRSLAAKISGGAENDELSADTSSVVEAYISGHGVLSSLVDINYVSLKLLVEQSTNLDEEVSHSAELVKEFKVVRQKNMEEGQKNKTILDEKQVQIDMAELKEVAEVYAQDIASLDIKTTKERLWRYYTVIRTYSNTLDKYKEMRDRGIIAEDSKGYDKMFDTYATLQEFFSVMDQSPETIDKMYFSDICVDLGIYTKEEFYGKFGRKSDKALKKIYEAKLKEDKTNELIESSINKHLTERTGSKWQYGKQIKDTEEKEYPEDVVNGIKRIDRWIAANSKQWQGNTESNFAVEILSHPIRERLFVYYTIEKNRQTATSGFDASMALNNYVPDLDAFKDKMEVAWWKVHQHLGSFVKRADWIRNTGLVDTYGGLMMSKLAFGMRLLDDSEMKIGEKLEMMSAERISMKDSSLPKSVTLRQECYWKFMEEANKHRMLIAGKNEEDLKNDKAAILQSERVSRALRLLVRANKAVGVEFEDAKKLMALQHEDGVREESDTVGNVLDGVGIASSIGNTITSTLEEKPHLWPWNIGEGDLNRLNISSGVFLSIGALTSLVSTVLAAKSVFEDGKSLSGGMKEYANFVDSISDLAGNAYDIMTYVAPEAEKTIEKYSDGLSGGLAIFSGSIELVTAGYEHDKVVEVSDDARKFAKEKDKKQGTKQGTEQGTLNTEETVNAVINIQRRMSSAEMEMASLKIAGGVASLVGALVPVAKPFTDIISTALDIGSKIQAFWLNKEQREKTIDEFIKMDDMLKKVMESDDAKKYMIEKNGVMLDSLKAELRKRTLNQMHYASNEEFFMDITTQYAKVMHRQIFFDDDGKQILVDNKEAVKERSSLRGLFPSLLFKYPEGVGQVPSPPVEEMARNLMRMV